MAKEKKDPLDKRFEDMVEKLASLNQNAGLQTIHADKIADLTAERNRIAAKASGLTEEEAGRRADVDAEMLKLQKQIEQDTKIAGEDAPKVVANQKILEKMKEKEEKRRFLQNQLTLKNIGTGLNNISENIGSKVEAGGSMLLKGIGVLALFAFLQSDTFKSIVGDIVDFVTDFIGLFTGEVDTLDFIKNNFIAIGVTLLLFSKKLIALGKIIAGIPAVISGIGAAFAGVKLFFTATFIPGLVAAFAGIKLFFTATLLPAITGFLVAAAPIVAVVASVAAVAYGIVRIFQGFEKHFSEANEQFGFFGGILAGFTGGIKSILLDVANVIDSILGFFGFPDAMDGIIKAIEDFDVMDFVSGVMDFFSELGDSISEAISMIGRFLKGLGLGAVAAFKALAPGGESPTEAFMRVFNETLAGGAGDTGTPDLANIAKAGAGMSGGENDPARFVARKENEDMQMARKEEMMGDKRAVMITNNNVINKGGDNYSEVRGGDVNVHDTAQNPYYNPA